MRQATSENTRGKSQPWESFKFSPQESPERPANTGIYSPTVRSLSVPTQPEDMAAGARCMPGILGSGPYDGSTEPSIIFSVLYKRKDTRPVYFCVCVRVRERQRKPHIRALLLHTLDSLFWMCLSLIFDWGCTSKIMAVVTLSIQLPPSRGWCDSRHLFAKASKMLEQILKAFSENVDRPRNRWLHLVRIPEPL